MQQDPVKRLRVSARFARRRLGDEELASLCTDAVRVSPTDTDEDTIAALQNIGLSSGQSPEQAA